MATIGQTITSAEFNTMRTNCISILGVGTGTSGYGQDTSALTSTSSGQLISASQISALRTLIAKAYAHQTNASVSNTVANSAVASSLQPPNLQLISSGSIIDADIYTQYQNFITNVVSNKASAHPAQLTSTSYTSATRTTEWGVSPSVISVTSTFTFSGYTQGSLTVSAADHMRCFFNAGGEISILSTLTGGTVTSKYTTWQNMLNGVGTLTLKASSTSVSGTGLNTGYTLATTTGFNNLTSTAVTLLNQPGPNGVYTENDYVITARKPTSNTLEFTVTYRDDDLGDQTGLGPAVDETINGTLTAAFSSNRPFGANVDIPAPTKSGSTSIA